MRRTQVVLPDGNCLYRSIAASAIYAFTGKNCGRGAIFGEEKTIANAVHNVVTSWIRTLVVHELATDKSVNIHTEWGGRSLYKTLVKIDKILEGNLKTKRFASKRHSRDFMRSLRAIPPPLKVGNGEKKFPIGFTAQELSMSGRKNSETFCGYCRRMYREGSWGGAVECYLACQVLMLPIHMLQRNAKPQIFLPDNEDLLAHRVTIRFDGHEHYDAVIEREVLPILRM